MQRTDARLLNSSTRSSHQRESQQLQSNVNAHPTSVLGVKPVGVV